MRSTLTKIILKIPKRFRNKKILAVTIVLISLYFIGNRGTGNSKLIKLTRAEIKPIKSIISASGVVKSESEATLRFQTAGKISWIGISLGDYVHKGQAIASLDSEKFEIALRQAQQDVVATDAILEKVYDDRRNKDKVESFSEKITRTDAERDKNQAYDELIEAQKNLKNASIYTPFTGTITSIDAQVGEEALTTTNIAQISDLTHENFVAEVDEIDIVNVKKEQDAKVILDSQPEKTFASSISKISPKSTTTSTGSTAYEVTFTLPKEELILLGMNGEVQVITDQKEGALTIPTEAVLDEKYIWVKTNGRFEKKEVVVGIQSDSEVEINKGVVVGDQIVISGAEEINKKSLLKKILSRILP